MGESVMTHPSMFGRQKSPSSPLIFSEKGIYESRIEEHCLLRTANSAPPRQFGLWRIIVRIGFVAHLWIRQGIYIRRQRPRHP